MSRPTAQERERLQATGPPGREPRACEARGVAYAFFSQLVASPFDAGEALAALPPEDLATVAAALEAGLPYAIDLSALTAAAAELTSDDAGRLARSYGSLFEVGDKGPPVPLRETLIREADPAVREEIVRFYDFFGYELREEWRWEPDHLAIELEFLHCLAYGESQAGDPESALSYQLAQLDFAERHLLEWVPGVVRDIKRRAEEPYQRCLFEVLGAFLERDHAWQRQRLVRKE